MAMEQLPQRPWSLPVTVADIPDGGSHYDLSADAAVRDAVAKFAGLRALSLLEASFDLARRGEGVAVSGELRANVGQTCVVTLEPIQSEVRETIDLVFMPTEKDDVEATEKRRGEPPEPLESGMVDLGAVATEFLMLGLDPYPRKPGVEFSRPEDEDKRASPFAALASLKKSP
jgi:uncharacterized metal-binding protein YceD (DUF177 family)